MVIDADVVYPTYMYNGHEGDDDDDDDDADDEDKKMLNSSLH
jgi:hypothetical protein